MPKAPPAEFREAAVRHVRSSGKRSAEIAADLTVGRGPLRTWLELDRADRVTASIGELLGAGARGLTRRARATRP